MKINCYKYWFSHGVEVNIGSLEVKKCNYDTLTEVAYHSGNVYYFTNGKWCQDYNEGLRIDHNEHIELVKMFSDLEKEFEKKDELNLEI